MTDYSISTEGYLGIAKETTYGIAIATPTKFIPILSETIESTSGGIFPEDIRADRHRHLVMEGPFGVAGDIEFQAGPENGLGQMLEGALGSSSTVGTAAPYTHTFTGTGQLPSYTTEISLGDTMIRKISGCKVGTLAFACAAGEPLVATATLTGRTEALGTAVTPTFSTLEPYKWSEARVTVDGTVDANIESMDLTIENNLVTDLRTLNQTRLVKDLPERGRVVTGSMDLNFTSDTQYRRFLGGGTAPQTTPWTGTLKFEWVRTDKNLTIEMDNVRFSTDAVHISGTDRIVEGIEFDAVYDTGATAELKVILVNTESTYT